MKLKCNQCIFNLKYIYFQILCYTKTTFSLKDRLFTTKRVKSDPKIVGLLNQEKESTTLTAILKEPFKLLIKMTVLNCVVTL